MEKIKFSIIIPTRERADTLVHALATCAAQDYDKLEIIVSDNFSRDNTREVVSSFSDPRIKYINTGKRLSMSHNWEFALGHVKDGWVTFLGDDDGLLPGAIAKVADLIGKTGCQAVTSKCCRYLWPDTQLQNNDWLDIMPYRLSVPIGGGFEVRDGGQWLGKLMQGEAYYTDLPFLYTFGFVDMQAINKARGPGGAFFLSMIPDVYSAVALASTLDRYVMLKEPVAVAGLSSHSIGAATLGLNKDKLDTGNKFFSEENIPFHPLLAGGELLKSVPIVVYECYLQSAHLHHDFLKIKMDDQLSLALALMTGQGYNDLREFCSHVAGNNGISMDVIDRKVKQWRRRLWDRRWGNIFSFVLGQLNLSGNRWMLIEDVQEFGVRDVHGAALLSRAIYLLETRYARVKMGQLFRLMKKGLRRISNPNTGQIQ